MFTEVEVLNEGAYCCVAKAKRHGQWWTLKYLSKDYANQPFYKSPLRKEYDVLCRLNYPSVVRAICIEDVDELGECLIMEYVQGQTLDKYKASRSERRRLCLLLLDGVKYIHSQQIVHRDLKPQNIIVTDNGHNLKIIDFGLSDTDNFAVLKQPAGTQTYVSPEPREPTLFPDFFD